MGKQSIALRQIPHSAMLRWQAAKGLAVGGQQASKGAQQRGLALAALPQQDGKPLDLEIDHQSHRMGDAVIDAHGLRTNAAGATPNRGSRGAASPQGRRTTTADT